MAPVQPSFDPSLLGREPVLVVRPLFRSWAAMYYVVGAAPAVVLIPAVIDLSDGRVGRGIGEMLISLVSVAFVGGLLAFAMRRMVIYVDDRALRWPGGRVKEVPRERIARVTRRLVGECLEAEDGTVLNVLPGFLTRTQVRRIVERLGVPHLNKHGDVID